MDNTLYLANALSSLGAVLLLTGFYQIGVKGSDLKGFIYSAVGSLVMCFSFYLFGSIAFIVMNLVWFFVSIYGIFNRKPKGKHKDPSLMSKKLSEYFFLSSATVCVFLYIVGSMEGVSWLVTILMFSAYLMFSVKTISRKKYICYSLLVSVLTIPYLLSINNYGTTIQLSIDICISLLSLYTMRGLVGKKTVKILN